MTELIFATNNQHKVEELNFAIGDKIKIISLKDAGIDIDIPEPHETLQENASEKSRTIHQLTGKNCFSEDTGLEVFALNGEPGVKSARYAGENKSFEKNIEKLLKNLADKKNRTAQFRTVISLILDDKECFFEGICAGEIISEQRGKNGFGYDPVFIPEGLNRTFAEMEPIEKNLYSHRKKAGDKLITFLQEYYGKN
ncbi:MAG TPA: RdgB/HAM1 family non-canonical purine NTP pyrophosphatase [Puia sp.]|jgi:XTP/dITP diphosphohydrolase|nr:RdgB/HAM1 family non-canonical purine NTP pyrophosphatase [Puia sp.]